MNEYATRHVGVESAAASGTGALIGRRPEHSLGRRGLHRSRRCVGPESDDAAGKDIATMIGSKLGGGSGDRPRPTSNWGVQLRRFASRTGRCGRRGRGRRAVVDRGGVEPHGAGDVGGVAVVGVGLQIGARFEIPAGPSRGHRPGGFAVVGHADLPRGRGDPQLVRGAEPVRLVEGELGSAEPTERWELSVTDLSCRKCSRSARRACWPQYE
jgi:hypothetical protein